MRVRVLNVKSGVIFYMGVLKIVVILVGFLGLVLKRGCVICVRGVLEED